MDWQGVIRDWLDADWVRYFLLPGLAAALLALVAARGERRRKQRSDPDAVPLMPWLALTFWASFAALLLLGVALRGWLSGGM